MNAEELSNRAITRKAELCSVKMDLSDVIGMDDINKIHSRVCKAYKKLMQLSEGIESDYRLSCAELLYYEKQVHKQNIREKIELLENEIRELKKEL